MDAEVDVFAHVEVMVVMVIKVGGGGGGGSCFHACKQLLIQ